MRKADQQSMTQHCPCKGQLRSDETADPDSRAFLDQEDNISVSLSHHGERITAMQQKICRE